jgi:hypothetical protein
LCGYRPKQKPILRKRVARFYCGRPRRRSTSSISHMQRAFFHVNLLKRVISAWGLYYFPLRVATSRPDRHNHVMGREPSEQTFPDLFSTDAVRDASTPPPPATKDATAQPEPQRHVLPKNLRNAVNHLNDEELDLLHTATLEERETARHTSAECWGRFGANASSRKAISNKG